MDRIEEKICRLIDEHQEEIKAFGRDIWHHGEMGYKEVRTSEKFAEYGKKYGLVTEQGLAVTGVKCYLKGKEKKGITVAVVGILFVADFKFRKPTNKELAVLVGIVGVAVLFILFYNGGWWEFCRARFFRHM